MLLFIIGVMLGGFVGMMTMCLFNVSSRWEAEQDEDMKDRAADRNTKN